MLQATLRVKRASVEAAEQSYYQLVHQNSLLVAAIESNQAVLAGQELAGGLEGGPEDLEVVNLNVGALKGLLELTSCAFETDEIVDLYYAAGVDAGYLMAVLESEESFVSFDVEILKGVVCAIFGGCDSGFKTYRAYGKERLDVDTDNYYVFLADFLSKRGSSLESRDKCRVLMDAVGPQLYYVAARDLVETEGSGVRFDHLMDLVKSYLAE